MNATSIIATAILIGTVPTLIAIFITAMMRGSEGVTFLRAYRNVWITIGVLATVFGIVYGVLYVGDAAFTGTWGFDQA